MKSLITDYYQNRWTKIRLTAGDGAVVFNNSLTHIDKDSLREAYKYLRVLEIPTPRWTAYYVKLFNIPSEDIPDGVVMLAQERAYTSPIWYSPSVAKHLSVYILRLCCHHRHK